MKSTEFILEEVTEQNIEEWAWLIKEDCQFYLRQNNPKNFPLYRGLKMEDEPFLKKRVRLKDRTPKDMNPELHHELNSYFQTKFGSPFRNAMFCTGNEAEATVYGAYYYVFPRGKFEFIWSPHIDDLFSLWDMHGDEDIFFDEVKNGDYTNKNLSNAIDSHHEIMIRCNSYYALSAKNENIASKVINLL